MKFSLFPSAMFLSTTLGMSSHAAVITDFNTFTQSANLLASPNTREQQLSVTTGANTNTLTFNNFNPIQGANVGQTVFLSDSFSLTNVGDRISADFGSIGGTFSNFAQGVGLAIASSESLSTRVNLITFQWRTNLTLSYISFDGDGANGGTQISAALSDRADSLFIEKTLVGYNLGYIEGGIETVQWSLTLGETNVSANGSVVGIYSDLRGDNQVNSLNNFAVTPIPEPGTALLGGLGLLALLRRRR